MFRCLESKRGLLFEMEGQDLGTRRSRIRCDRFKQTDFFAFMCMRLPIVVVSITNFADSYKAHKLF